MLPISEDKINKEIDIIKQIALGNGYPLSDTFKHKQNVTQNTPQKIGSLSHIFTLLSGKSPTYLRTHTYA
jgi:hypothetical protein